MNLKLLLIFCVNLLANYVQSNPIFTPCKTSDYVCIERSINEAIPKLLSADPSLGLEELEPIYLPAVEADLSIIKYNFTHTNTFGYKNCTVSNFRADINALTFHLDIICPKIKLEGDFVVSGHLLSLPVDGQGGYKIETGTYKITVDGKLDKTESDGKTYIAIKKIKLKNKGLEPIRYTFNNLLNGREELADTVNKFANENWKEVSDLLQDPAVYANFGKIVSNVNKYLKTTPLEQMVISNA